MAETVKLKKRDMLRWSPAKISPLIPDAGFTVRCLACGYGHDSDAETDLEALDEVAAMHDPAHAVALRIQWSKSPASPVAPTGLYVKDDAASLSSLSSAASTALDTSPGP